MEMELYDNVKLIEEIEELSQRGIHKNCLGLIVKKDDDIYTVGFFNPKNLGEYIFAKVSRKHLTFVVRSEDNIIRELKEKFSTKEFNLSESFSKPDVKEYDQVELIVEKSRYAKDGVHKGARGSVISSYAISDEWLILFFEQGTGKDIADITVNRKDFKIIE